MGLLRGGEPTCRGGKAIVVREVFPIVAELAPEFPVSSPFVRFPVALEKTGATALCLARGVAARDQQIREAKQKRDPLPVLERTLHSHAHRRRALLRRLLSPPPICHLDPPRFVSTRSISSFRPKRRNLPLPGARRAGKIPPLRLPASSQRGEKASTLMPAFEAAHCVGARAGVTDRRSTNAVAGVRRAFTGRPRPGTGWAVLFGAASTT